MTHWVVDASPLIFLAKLERLQLLRDAADEIVVPERVLSEIQKHGDRATAVIERACESWLKPAAAPSEDVESATGELAVIELGLRMSADRVVLDDLAARKAARGEGLPVIGTLGLLLAGRLRGEIESLSREIDRLAAHGFRASDELIARLLSEAGER